MSSEKNSKYVSPLMSRPQTKQQLQEASTAAYQQLKELVESLTPTQRKKPGVNGKWCVKDVLAHLTAWHGLMRTWYDTGMAGDKPQMPAPGYTWKTTPDLNQAIYQEHADESYEHVQKNLQASYQDIQTLIDSHTNEELFTKKRYPWTGSTSLGSYLISATSSHYLWAIDLIKKWQKNT